MEHSAAGTETYILAVAKNGKCKVQLEWTTEMQRTNARSSDSESESGLERASKDKSIDTVERARSKKQVPAPPETTGAPSLTGELS